MQKYLSFLLILFQFSCPLDTGEEFKVFCDPKESQQRSENASFIVSLSTTFVTLKQLESPRHQVTLAALRDTIKRTFDRGTYIDRRSNPFKVLLPVKIYSSSRGSGYKHDLIIFIINNCTLILTLRSSTSLFHQSAGV
jgi:hypothetical protein